ncbi:MAG: hypothetical protein IJ466_08725 [Clostridia bacterium]|nr:hypothetical protein [Clostridia bacterium]
MEILNWILKFVLIGLGLLAIISIPAAYTLLRDKIDDAKVAEIFAFVKDGLKDAVAHLNNTFVNPLKAEGKFSLEKQAEAFKKAMGSWLKGLSEDMLEIVKSQVGDFEEWATNALEGEVYRQKMEAVAVQYAQEAEADVDIDNWPIEQLQAFCILNGVETEGCEDREDYIAAIEEHFE